MRSRRCVARFSRLALIAPVLGACAPGQPSAEAAAESASSVQHVTVAAAPDRFKRSPGSGGMWAWGREMLVIYMDCGLDTSQGEVGVRWPCAAEQARSLDGGLSWVVETPRTQEGREITYQGQTAPELESPMDFTHPDFALAELEAAPERGSAITYLYYSYDRGRHWIGPYATPFLDFANVDGEPAWVSLEPDYIVDGPRELMAFGYYEVPPYTSETEGAVLHPGKPFIIRTRDGGLTWSAVAATAGTITPPNPPGVYFGIEPSTVRLLPTELLSLSRWIWRPVETSRQEASQKEWIEAWRSEDDGATWFLASRFRDGLGMRPNVVSLPDGRVVVTYAYREAPAGMRARISEDGGWRWSDPFVLRDDAFDEVIGYSENALRPDGKIVTVYYFNQAWDGPVTIEATIWDPDVAFPR